ncbi:response regulator transcription factor [Cohnella rhizosphaerae]|uniref:Response regulator n=1 Tax=Cohnella rhizosphaerae TaxID=1457232 RepID=A0A9X4KZM0_9BACL|nr:response regulator [Cohnella rhizosphaerae]MDG0813473.1 response regulator [Cohnella rhizosphaerae]
MYKVMIVDDEAVIRKGLVNFIDWNALDCEVVCEASDGLEAAERLAVHEVHIIVTDIRMAGMDGIELSKFVYENFPQIKVILLTAFADFTYAQSAVKYQAVDFVVKTNPSEKIPDAINKAKQLLVKEKDHERKLIQLENIIKDSRSEVREKFLKDAVYGIITDEAELLNGIAKLAIQLEHYYVIDIEIHDDADPNGMSASEEFRKFADSIQQFFFLAFEADPHYTFVLNHSSLLALVSFPARPASDCTRTLLSICHEILFMAESFMRFSASIGISSRHRDILTLSSAYAESCQAMEGSFYNENHVSFYAPRSGQAPSLESRPYDVAQQIIEGLQEGQYDTAIRRFNQLMENYRSVKEPIENIKAACLLIGSYCYNRLEARKPLSSYSTGDEPSLYKQIQESRSIHSLLHIIEKLIVDLSDALSVNDRQHNYIVVETQKYIRENFNRNLSLQVIADHIHVNSSYLSRLYRRETGESIVDAINKHRIEIAKKLLKDPSKKSIRSSECGRNRHPCLLHPCVYQIYRNKPQKNIN